MVEEWNSMDVVSLDNLVNKFLNGFSIIWRIN